jgi:hypothetical protein
LINGIQKFLTQYASLTVGSQSVAPADIVKDLQDRITLANAVVTAEASRAAAIKANLDKRAQTATLLSSLRGLVRAMFTQSPDTLAAFGLKAPKASKKTVAVKAVAVALNVATRKARNTMGKKAKLKVKGTLPAATSGSAAAPATPAKPTT